MSELARQAGASAADDSSAVDVLVEAVTRYRARFTPAELAARARAVEEFYEQNRDPHLLTAEEWREQHAQPHQ